MNSPATHPDVIEACTQGQAIEILSRFHEAGGNGSAIAAAQGLLSGLMLFLDEAVGREVADRVVLVHLGEQVSVERFARTKRRSDD